MKGLVIVGIDSDMYRIADTFHILHRDAELKAAWMKMNAGSPSISGLPEDMGELFQNKIIFICDINLRALGLKFKNAIREYVRRGGALIVFGGHQSYERGGWRGSLIEEAMPLQSAPALSGGITRFQEGRTLSISSEEPYADGISTAEAPLVYYLHNIELKPSARIMAKAGDQPFMVGGSYGDGRVVCVLAPPWGDPKEGETPFWKWPDWPYLLREACWWAMKSPLVLTPENSDGFGK